MDNHDVGLPLAKAASAWAVVGITSWADFASALAALYTLILIGEWLVKKARARGWITVKRTESEE